MEVVVTSYCRPKYLQQTLESLRQDRNVQVYVVDGGSDGATRALIQSLADDYLFLEGNPGADVLKNEGVKHFVTGMQFLLSSDDLVYPAGYSELIWEQYRELNQDFAYGVKWSFMACNLDYIAQGFPEQFIPINGVRVRETAVSQVAGAIIDAALFHQVGGFPVYGKSGQGDHAFSKRLRSLGVHVGYFWKPVVDHIGRDKSLDYPEYAKRFREDEDYWVHKAIEDSEK